MHVLLKEDAGQQSQVNDLLVQVSENFQRFFAKYWYSHMDEKLALENWNQFSLSFLKKGYFLLSYRRKQPEAWVYVCFRAVCHLSSKQRCLWLLMDCAALSNYAIPSFFALITLDRHDRYSASHAVPRMEQIVGSLCREITNGIGVY